MYSVVLYFIVFIKGWMSLWRFKLKLKFGKKFKFTFLIINLSIKWKKKHIGGIYKRESL